jgi:hypothetical protein
MKLIQTILMCALLSFPVLAHGASKDSSSVRGDLTATGVQSNAVGKLQLTVQPTKSQLNISLSGLTPNTNYTLVVDGVEQQQFTTSKSGKASLRFSQPPGRKDPALDFDPRGRLLTINLDTNVVLFITVAGTNEPPGIKVSETVTLDATPLAGAAKATARFQINKDRSTFQVEIEKLTGGGAFNLAVDGVQRGVITVNTGGRGKIEFDSTPKPPKVLLDFDPRGKVVDITQGTNLFFTSQFLASGNGVSVCSNSVVEWPLISTGLDTNAQATAKFRVRDDCRRDFQVEAEDLDPGAYDFFVGGVARGILNVTNDGGNIQGEIEFSTDLDEGGKLPLSFDPLTELIQIKQGTNVFFSGSGATTAPTGTNCTPVSTELPFVNAGVVGSAKGKARYRVNDDCSADFRVEIEDLPVGAYNLRVGGAIEGVVTVANVGGDNTGEIQFATSPDDGGELLLTFDPRSRLIEVEQGGTVMLSRSFP